jgi:hypothetical protein
MGISINGGLNITLSSQLGEFPSRRQMEEVRRAELGN